MRFPRLGTPRGWRVLLSTLVILAVGIAFSAKPVVVHYQIFRAERALAERDSTAALLFLEAAEKWDPHNARVAFLMGRASRVLGRMDDLGTHLRRAWELGYSQEKVHREEFLAMAQAGQLAEAEPHLSEMLVNPGDDLQEICEAFVNGYLVAYRIEPAFGLLENWEADYPLDPQPHFIRGLYWSHSNNQKSALESFQKALALAPRRIDIQTQVALAQFGVGNFEEAELQLTRLLKVDPANAILLAARARCLVERGDLELARQVIQELLREHPTDFDGRLALAQLELKANQPREGLRILKQLADERPYHYHTRYSLASAASAAGEKELAREHFAFVGEAERSLSKARNLLDKAKDNPDDVETRFELGKILIRYQSPVDGAAWLQGALELQPDHQGAHEELARYYEQTGNKKLADQHRRQASPPAKRKQEP